MKNKILLGLLLLISVIFALTVSVGAITLQESIDLYEGYFEGKDVEYIDGITAQEHINPEIYAQYSETAVNARVELSCSCGNSHVYPTYYITKYYAEGESIGDNQVTFKGSEVFHVKFDDINAKNPCGASYDKNSVVAIEIPDGYKVIDGGAEQSGSATYLHGLRASTSLKFVDMTTCTTVVDLDDASYHEAFGNCGALEYVKLADSITEIGGWAFDECVNLKRVVISENSQLKKIGKRSFYGCVALEALYLPEGLTTLDGRSDEDHGAFTKCTSLYFVNDPEEITKPEIYYFPQSLTTVLDEAFKNCPSLNRYLVFGEKLTEIKSPWTFVTNGKSGGPRNENNPITVIFTGNMTTFAISNEMHYTSYVFANPSQGEIKFTYNNNNKYTNTSAYISICANGTRSLLANTVSFSTEGFAHHVKTANVGVKYDNYYENGYRTHLCFCGAEVCGAEAELEPVFEDYGFSVPEASIGGRSVIHGFFINREAMAQLGAEVDYGIVADVNKNGVEYSPAAEGALVVSFATVMCDVLEIKIINIPENQLDTPIVFCGYITVDGVLSYLDNGGTYSKVTGTSYNSIIQAKG